MPPVLIVISGTSYVPPSRQAKTCLALPKSIPSSSAHNHPISQYSTLSSSLIPPSRLWISSLLVAHPIDPLIPPLISLVPLPRYSSCLQYSPPSSPHEHLRLIADSSSRPASRLTDAYPIPSLSSYDSPLKLLSSKIPFRPPPRRYGKLRFQMVRHPSCLYIHSAYNPPGFGVYQLPIMLSTLLGSAHSLGGLV